MTMNYSNENIEKIKNAISKKDFFFDIKTSVIDWSRRYPESNENEFLENLLLEIIKVNNLNRVQSYSFVLLIYDLIEDAGLMNDFIDNNIDWLYSRLNGECSKEAILTFPEDPTNIDIRDYARSYVWTSFR
jgi:hypothetical protein